MKAEEIIYDILEIKNAANDDSDIDETWLLYKINLYRAVFIQEYYAKTGEVDPSWVQQYPVFNFIKSYSSDDPGITSGSINIGKFLLPPIVSLPDDIGLYQVFGVARAVPLSRTDIATMIYRAGIQEDLPFGSGFFTRQGNMLYVYPYIMKGQISIIAVNPMDIPYNDNGTIRAMTYSDNYPVDPGMAENIVLAILTRDLKILEESIPEIINDSQSQLKILKTDGGIQVPRQD